MHREPSFRRWSSTLLALALLGSAMRVSAQPVSKRFVERRSVHPTVVVRVTFNMGHVDVETWDKDSLLIMGSAPERARVDVFVGDETGGPARTAKVYIEQEVGPLAMDVTIRVPRKAQVWVKGELGAISASGGAEELQLSLLAGAVRVSGEPKALAVDVIDGSIDVAGAPGTMRLKTAKGRVTAACANELDITTTDAEIQLTAGTVRRGRITSSRGRVVVGCELARGADVRVDVFEAPVEVRLPRTSRPEVSVQSSRPGGIDDRWSVNGVRAKDSGPELVLPASGPGPAGLVIIRNYAGTTLLVPR
jgi:hypothetical protein